MKFVSFDPSIVTRQKRRATICEILIGSRFDREVLWIIYIYIFWEFEIQVELAFHQVSISMRFYLAFEHGLDGKLSYYRLTLTIALLFSTRIRSVGERKKKTIESIYHEWWIFIFNRPLIETCLFISFFFFRRFFRRGEPRFVAPFEPRKFGGKLGVRERDGEREHGLRYI